MTLSSVLLYYYRVDLASLFFSLVDLVPIEPNSLSESESDILLIYNFSGFIFTLNLSTASYTLEITLSISFSLFYRFKGFSFIYSALLVLLDFI